MTRPIVRIHDLETNKTIDREMNDTEFTLWESDQAKIETEKEAEAAKAHERTALLERLGITEDEAQLLLGGN